jgi:hypothetical protein
MLCSSIAESEDAACQHGRFGKNEKVNRKLLGP